MERTNRLLKDAFQRVRRCAQTQLWSFVSVFIEYVLRCPSCPDYWLIMSDIFSDMKLALHAHCRLRQSPFGAVGRRLDTHHPQRTEPSHVCQHYFPVQIFAFLTKEPLSSSGELLLFVSVIRRWTYAGVFFFAPTVRININHYFQNPTWSPPYMRRTHRPHTLSANNRYYFQLWEGQLVLSLPLRCQSLSVTMRLAVCRPSLADVQYSAPPVGGTTSPDSDSQLPARVSQTIVTNGKTTTANGTNNTSTGI